MGADPGTPYVPPEDWHEPSDTADASYRVIVQRPGKGYRHVVTEDEVRDRLAALPSWMLEPLEVVQLSRMTRKKRMFPCYGMQWGNSLYLYPLELSLTETYTRPPSTAVRIETAMFGAQLIHNARRRTWRLVWTERSIRDFYLNNVLIHELGHLLDDRNNSYIDRERYAEWFAIEYGYKPSRRKTLAQRARRRVFRRHHGK